MSARNAPAGYTLVELLIAITMSSIVLVGIYSIVSTFVNIEVEGVKRGSITGWSLAGIDAMNREIEGANVMVWPTVALGADDTMTTCMNWSRITAGPATGGNLNGVGISGGGGVGQNVLVYYYCYDSGNKILRRMVTSGATCPAAAAGPACTSAGYTGGLYGANNVIATSVYRSGAAKVFTRDDALNAVRIRFIVGNPNPTPNTPLAGPNYGNVTNPQTLPMDTRVSLDRPIGNIPSGD